MAKQSGGTPLKALARDTNQEAVQTGSSFVVADATGTPKTSPLAVSSSVITITVPDRAIEFIVNPSAAMRISSEVAMATYDVIAANTKESIPCARMQSIYVIRDSGDLTLNFRFTLV